MYTCLDDRGFLSVGARQWILLVLLCISVQPFDFDFQLLVDLAGTSVLLS